MNKISTIEVEEAVARYFGIRQNIIVPNVSWGFYIHECDLLIIRKSGCLLEVEIKVNKNDLKNDLKKEHGHKDDRIKELWFAIPEYMEDCIEFIPERAGVILVYMNDWVKRYCCRTVRKAVVNNKATKLYDNEKLMIARLGAMRIWGLKRKIIDMRKKRSKKRIILPENQLSLAI